MESDLDGEGLNPACSPSRMSAWFYKRNLRRRSTIARLRQPATAILKPSSRPSKSSPPSLLRAGARAGGRRASGSWTSPATGSSICVVLVGGRLRGFYVSAPSMPAGSRSARCRFRCPTSTGHDDPTNLRFIDLDGDGHADVLITEGDLHSPGIRSLASRTASAVPEPPAQAVRRREGPAPGLRRRHAQSIFLADMSGDGLSDLVRIRNAEVCYWPNLGYGRFGAKVTMDSAPWF